MRTLLIVDDDRHLLESLRVVFSESHHVLTSLSAEDALVVLDREPIEVILLDVILPGQDGIEFLQTIRATHPDLPVVMISGAPSIRPVMRALELGACDYIRKPFDIDELRLVVERAVKSAGLKQRVKELERKLNALPNPEDHKPLKTAVEEYERIIIKDALRRNNGVQTRAAKELGTTRRILSYRIGKLKIEP
ncbi:MAG: response regulator [Kiritimatiellales bacterium]|nr:response regulator [Kiritimatiellota bacterium]MBL7011827.1 response regulator [Kiritimatiellales bacterium]